MEHTPAYAWMWYRAMRRHLGEWHMKRWLLAQIRWYIRNPLPESGYYLCELCGYLIMTRKAFTFDHIIPRDQVIVLDLPSELLFEDNLQAAHARCNQKKGNAWQDLTLEGEITYDVTMFVNTPKPIIKRDNHIDAVPAI